MEEKQMEVGSAEAGPIIITDQLYDRLSGMLASKDPGDHKMAQLIINKVDVEKSIYFIWKLARSYSHEMVNLRTKDSRAFRDACDLFVISWSDAYEFGRWLVGKGWMTSELFMKIKTPIQESAFNRDNEFYEYSINLKEGYKGLDPSDELISEKNFKT